MKEYCLVPVSIAEKYMYTTVPTTATTPTITHSSTPPRLSQTSLPSRNNPPLEDLIRVAVSPAYREYGISLVKLLDGKPNIAWDEKGNFFPPFSGLNIVHLINILANPKGKFSSQEKPLVSMLFRLAQLSPDVIRNTRQKQLVGGSWLAY